MDSDQPPSTSTAPLSSAIASPASDVAAHRSCQWCSRRMSSYKYDKHTLCYIVGMLFVQWKLGVLSVAVGLLT